MRGFLIETCPFRNYIFYMINSKHGELIKDAVLGFNKFHSEDHLSKLESISFDKVNRWKPEMNTI